MITMICDACSGYIDVSGGDYVLLETDPPPTTTNIVQGGSYPGVYEQENESRVLLFHKDCIGKIQEGGGDNDGSSPSQGFTLLTKRDVDHHG